LNWFGNPAVVLEQETRGFATPPRGGCAISPDAVWFAPNIAFPWHRRNRIVHKRMNELNFYVKLRPCDTVIRFSAHSMPTAYSPRRKGKPIERWGRKASGLKTRNESTPAELPAPLCMHDCMPRVCQVSADKRPLTRSSLPDSVCQLHWSHQGGHTIEILSVCCCRRTPAERLFF
jgi:hypothetical protein